MSDPSDLGAWLGAFLRDPTFLDRYPYYAAVLGKMHPVADPSVKRLAVSLFDGRFFLHINVESFVDEPRYLRGVLLHEVHHVVLGHLAHPKFQGAADPELMDLALEMSANEHIEEPLPDPIVWQAYTSVGIRAGQSSIERYEKLYAAARAGAPRSRPGGGGGEPERRVAGVRREQPVAGARREQPVDDHRFWGRRVADPGAVEHTRQLVQSALDEVGAPAEGADPRSALLAGKSPGRLLEDLTGVASTPRAFLDWKTALRMFVARARAPRHTWARPSRRFPEEVGRFPGRTWSPGTITRPSLLVAIDTSMSMSATELEEVARQLAALSEHARVTVVECDTEITRCYAFTGMLEDVAGRGGTDLRPVFDDAFLAAHPTNGIVYFTDGAGPCPAHAPRLPVLWVLTKPNEFPCPWGERAKLTREARAAASKRPARARRRA